MTKIEKDRFEDLFKLISEVSIATKRENVSSYDFDFRNYFEVKTIIGETGLKLINSVEEHNKSNLPLQIK